MKYILTFLLAVVAVFNGIALPVDVETARLKAFDFFVAKTRGENMVKSLTPSARELQLVYPAETKARTMTDAPVYVFALPADKGFIMTSADDVLPAVLGYSFESAFDSRNIPVQLNAVLESYAAIVLNARSGMALAVESLPAGKDVAPMLSTRWDQGSPYNCYLNDDGARSYVTGCTATATSQIMNYHQWPAKGSGIVKPRNVFSEIDLSGSVYDWANMLDVYTSDSFNSDEALAVGLLMRDVGFAINSQYGSQTGASIETPAFALVRNFGYSPDVRFALRYNYSTKAWNEAIRNSLENGMPVLLGGQSPDGGHAFVCDGIDADNYLHINWGWGGSSDGYFDMNILSPANLGIGAGSGSYNVFQNAIFNIYPDKVNTPDPSGYVAPLTLIDFSVDRKDIETDGKLATDVVTLLYQPFNSSGRDIGTDRQILVVPVVLDVDNQVVATVSSAGGSFQLPMSYWADSPISLQLPVEYLGNLADGDYSLALRYTFDVTDGVVNTPSPSLQEFNHGDLITTQPFTKKGSGFYFTPSSELKDDAGNVRLVSVKPHGSLYLGKVNNSVDVTLFNDATKSVTGYPVDQEAYGMLFFVPEADNPVNLENLFDDYNGIYFRCYLYQGTEITVNVPVGTLEEYCPSPGTYRVYVALISPDGYNFYPLESDEGAFVEVEPLPAEGDIIFSRPFEMSRSTYERSNEGTAIQFTIYPIIEWEYVGYFQVRATYLGDDTCDDEYIIYNPEASGFSREHLYAWFTSYRSNSIKTYTLNDAPLGEYEARVYYENGDGAMVPVSGPNNMVRFTLVDNVPDVGLLQLAAPAVINNGNDVPLGESGFDIVLELIAPNGIDLGDSGLEITFLSIDRQPLRYSQPANTVWGGFEITRRQLEPGQSATATFHLTSAVSDSDFKPGDTFRFYVSQQGTGRRVRTYPHHDSTLMTLADESSGIAKIDPDNNGIYINDNMLYITGTTGNALITVYDISGRLIMATDACSIPLAHLQSGIYVLTVKDSHRTTTLKFQK